MSTHPRDESTTPTIFTAAEAAALLDRCMRVRSSVDRVFDEQEQARRDVIKAYERLREQLLLRELSALPLDRLRAASTDRLRLDPFERAHIRSVGDLVGKSVGQLTQIRGIGEHTARAALDAAAKIADAARDHIQVRLNSETAAGIAGPVVSALHRCLILEDALSSHSEALRSLSDRLARDTPALRTLSSHVRRLFAGRRRRMRASAAAARIDAQLAKAQSAGQLTALAAAEAASTMTRGTGRVVINDFELRAARYISLLELLVGTGPAAEAAHGYLPGEDVARIEQQELNPVLLRTRLRVYQAFGARFALQRRRVILGDEMGTGKTIQAIATMAHLAATGRSHFFVVCPATVLINWTREIAAHSSLAVHVLHGTDKQQALRTWIDAGGVAVTTFDTLSKITVSGEVRVAALVVDEAHFVKNLRTQRSRTVRGWTDRVDRVLFLTGTPLENRVDEFCNLVGYLQPDVARRVTGLHGASGARAFRTAVAPAYLRRNQEDVLAELPEEIRIDNWEELTAVERTAYRTAVLHHNFAAMRQAAYTAGAPNRSAKLRRVREIVEEACDDGRSVVVFSAFLKVLALVHREIEELFGEMPTTVPVFGPLTGQVEPTKRQQIVDAFTTSTRPAVLTAQIVAGGTGLNLQAASVVILCEPQLKPSTEKQAIARAQRMGQTRRVTVHRLMATDSVDERLLELLKEKQDLFDAYARRSETADRHPEAKDVSEGQLERMLLNWERHRVIAWTTLDESSEAR